MSERRTKLRKSAQRKAPQSQPVVQAPILDSQQQWNVGVLPTGDQFEESNLYNAQNYSVPFQSQTKILPGCGDVPPSHTLPAWSPEQNNNASFVSQEQNWNAQQHDSWNWQPADVANQPQPTWGDYSYQPQVPDPSAWAQQGYYEGAFVPGWHQNMQVTGQTAWQTDSGLANYDPGHTNHGAFTNMQENVESLNNGNAADFSQPAAEFDSHVNSFNENVVVAPDASASQLDICNAVNQEPSEELALTDASPEDNTQNEKIDEPNQEVLEPVQNVEVSEPLSVPETKSATPIPESFLHNVSKDSQESAERVLPEQQNQESPVNGPSISESRKVVIQPREGSLFQPPSSHLARKGAVVQHEMPVESTQKVALHEPESANLETEPDNLEKPPDVEVPRRQHLSLHRHLTNTKPSLDCTTLWESPDIPSVTLMPSLLAVYNPSSPDNVAALQRITTPTDVPEHDVKEDAVDKKSEEPKKSPTTASEESKPPVADISPATSPSFHSKNDDRGKELPANNEDRYDSRSASRHRYDEYEDRRDFSRSTESPRYRDDRHQYYYEEERRNADSRYYRNSRPSSRSSEPFSSSERNYYRDGESRKQHYEERERRPSRTSETEQYYSSHRRGEDYSDRKRYDDRYSREQDYYQRREYSKGYDYGPYRQPYSSYYPYYDPYQGRYTRSYDYGFYDEMYRMDPRYREQMEQHYRSYYGTYGEVESDRLSIHSSHSSVTDELHKASSRDKYNKEFDTSSDYSGYNHSSNLYDKSYSNDEAESYGFDSGGVLETTPRRLTPCRFTCPHVIARFSAGRLIKVVASDSDTAFSTTVQIHDLQSILNSEDERKEISSFPGPLVRGQTHKNDVMHFCNEKIKEVQIAKDVHDRESKVLLWELLVLLLRQNGSLVGSDIAELLLKGHEALQPPKIVKSYSDSLNVGGSDMEYSLDSSSPDEGIVVSQDKTVIGSSVSMSVEVVTQKFREYLLFGHKKDALEWAIKNALWGHALFLASKMDPRTYANVMTRFANSLTLNDPLQTLYQLMSGRQPAAVTNVLDDKWGDWKPHLAMILSNPSAQSDVDQRSIMALGDTLAQKGSLCGSHFCYLMAQVDFGSFELKSSKMVLLGSSHLQLFQEFSNCTAVHCTEIYEYAQSLANPYFILPHLQPYKFLYATKLAECGFLQEAVHYCEILSGLALQVPSYFSYVLLSQIYELGNKLKYHDPCFTSGQGELEEQTDPVWLQNLLHLMQMPLQNEKPSYETEQPQTFEEVPTPSFVPVHQNYSSELHQNYSSELHQNYSSEPYSSEAFVSSSGVNPSQDVPPTYTAPVLSSVEENYSAALEANSSPPPTINASSSFDYYGFSSQKTFGRERQDSVNSLGRRSSSASTTGPPPLSAPPKVENREEQPKETPKKVIKPQTGRSWLGGIFGKFLPKGENQMILPDDKNPTIVWDPAAGKWVNTDADSNSSDAPPQAPPTDSQLKFKDVQHNDAPPPATPGINRFQRPKIKAMKQNYVDILKNSGHSKPAPTPLIFPEQSSLPQNHFIPTPGHNEEPTPVEFAGQSSVPQAPPPIQDATDVPLSLVQKTEEVLPTMFDPAEFNTSYNVTTGNVKTSRLGRRTYLR